MIDHATILNTAFDATGVKFHDRAAALAELKKDGREITFNEDGTASFPYDSETLPLADALLRFGYDRRDLVDARTLPREGAGAARPGLLSKADFATTADRVKFINKRGLLAYEKLPSSGVGSNEVKTKSDWLKLPLAERVRRTTADPDAFSKLADAPPTVASAGMTRIGIGGTNKVSHAGLEKARRIRPNR
jgi:hypothetical protein